MRGGVFTRVLLIAWKFSKIGEYYGYYGMNVFLIKEVIGRKLLRGI